MAWSDEARAESARVRHLKALMKERVAVKYRKPKLKMVDFDEYVKEQKLTKVVADKPKPPKPIKQKSVLGKGNPEDGAAEARRLGVRAFWTDRLRDMMDTAITVMGRPGGDREVSLIKKVTVRDPANWPLKGSGVYITRYDGKRFKLWMDSSKKFKVTPMAGARVRATGKFRPPLYD
jgi:hypothetical protein